MNGIALSLTDLFEQFEFSTVSAMPEVKSVALGCGSTLMHFDHVMEIEFGEGTDGDARFDPIVHVQYSFTKYTSE